ncbi:outer membrane biogenesis protein BamB [Posidoniimonas corsicana]|uniref:Outer membrane biogenesis protein BamB n=1 Tax=Posidoniimonas corsicana TaxID=1938618 RepID=A0A5C5VDU7_9BACT|nr:PQQ-binding-like beta-propeller repeat protein [Posidoniimonas corsicana]TWT36173.1 outer membrane biogenesis protein BamB [Posidoniimonas corsicana]
MPPLRTLSCLSIAALSLSILVVRAEADWPQWRGTNRDAHAPDGKWPTSLGEEHLQLSWRKELGPSYSGPIVVGDRVFTTETRGEKTEVASAYDRNTGEKLWELEWPGAMQVPFFAASNGSWIRATPACDGQTLSVVGMLDVLVAIDVESGEELWRVDFPAELSVEPPQFGAASSPLLHEGSLYAQMGHSIVKVDAQTGKTIWRIADKSGDAFSSPWIGSVAGEQLLVVQAREELLGIAPDSGQVRWSQPIQAYRGMNIMTPTVYEDQFFTSAHSGRSQLWQVTEGADPTLDERWSNSAQAYMSSPVVVGDYLYMHLKNERLQCVDLRTGEEAWRSRPEGKYQSLVVVGGNVLALRSDGELILFRATPEAFEVLDRRKVANDETWAHLAVCDGKIFVRELNALAVYDWK